ncbi:hypothetical protein OIV83_001828 [Microbotryomycetes sp. JL201]|nr:hypothetical protein OIV83_001828 [Microbotryomycetes sp. JL201]
MSKELQQRILSAVPPQVMSALLETHGAIRGAPLSAASLIALNHAVNAIGGAFFFKIPHDIPKLRIIGFAISYLACAIVSLHQAATTSSTKARRNASLLLASASTTLYWWTVKYTRQRPLTAIHSQDQPGHVFDTGPYALVRHPFYTAYLGNFAAGAVASNSRLGWLAFLGAVAIYLQGARNEESKFAQSELARKYSLYKRRVSMFVPYVF